MSPIVRNRTISLRIFSLRQQLHERIRGVEHAVALEHLALVREVDLRQRDVLEADVFPDVELGPVRQREHAQVLAARGRGRCRATTARGAGSWDPTARTRRGALKIRSFARALSSSRRAPPIAASNWCSSMASSSVVVCSRLREARGPVSSVQRGPCRSSPGRARRSAARRARRRAGRDTRSSRGSCARCRRGAAGTETAPGETPSRRVAAARSSPCRPRTASTGVHVRPRARGGCGQTRLREPADGCGGRPQCDHANTIRYIRQPSKRTGKFQSQRCSWPASRSPRAGHALEGP